MCKLGICVALLVFQVVGWRSWQLPLDMSASGTRIMHESGVECHKRLSCCLQKVMGSIRP
jgi:hypothetical protein